jgi:hypothetical protein
MSARTAGTTGGNGGRTAGGWRASLPELIIAAVLMTAVTVAAYGWAGASGAAMVLACGAILALVLVRVLPDVDARPEAQAEEWAETSQTTIAGFWRRRGVVKNATLSMAAFEAELRPTLQHLLAARLAQRHGMSLYDEPEAARSLLLSAGWDNKLWYWLDPQRPPRPEERSGVPLRTLTAIIQRLEKL